MSTCCVSGLSWIYCLEKKFNCPDRAMAVKEARVVVYGWEFNMYICHEPLLSNLNLTYDRNLSEIHWMSFTITQYRNESRLRRIIIIKDMGPLTYFLILFKERASEVNFRHAYSVFICIFLTVVSFLFSLFMLHKLESRTIRIKSGTCHF